MLTTIATLAMVPVLGALLFVGAPALERWLDDAPPEGSTGRATPTPGGSTGRQRVEGSTRASEPMG